GRLVTPGLVDLHVHLREPGQEIKETIATGSAAAAAGGFTSICAMPNTDPVTDSPERVRFVADRGCAARGARVFPIAAATLGSRGETPTDAAALRAAGAVALSDDGLPIATAKVLEQVLAGARAAGLPVADHCEDRRLSAGGAILAGPVAERLGVGGIPRGAESVAVARDLEVLARAGGRLHLCHLSTGGSAELLRNARQAGLPVTAETTPHHLALSTELVLEQGALAKMNPPLAGDGDREALIAALADGTIDCIATDHAPHTVAEKAVGLDRAPFGIVGLETAFGLLHTALVVSGAIDLVTLIERITLGPARAFGLPAGRLAPGDPADVAVFDLAAEWTVEPHLFRSRSRNTPIAGRRLIGRPILTLVGGEVVYDGR
ncbi:MAG TPA: dihydroorotase, partial [Gemmatimonadota bacterium]|nr:dihydroorotase [Gemmatimonadota bacterium]